MDTLFCSRCGAESYSAAATFIHARGTGKCDTCEGVLLSTDAIIRELANVRCGFLDVCGHGYLAAAPSAIEPPADHPDVLVAGGPS